MALGVEHYKKHSTHDSNHSLMWIEASNIYLQNAETSYWWAHNWWAKQLSSNYCKPYLSLHLSFLWILCLTLRISKAWCPITIPAGTESWTQRCRWHRWCRNRWAWWDSSCTWRPPQTSTATAPLQRQGQNEVKTRSFYFYLHFLIIGLPIVIIDVPI